MLRLLRACEVPWPLPFLRWRHPVFAGSWNDPPRRILCAKTARLGGRYPHISSTPLFPFSASRPASQSPPSVAGRMIGACRSCGQKVAPISADFACCDLRPQVSSRNLADPPASTEAIRRCEAHGRHSDGSASPPPDSAPFWSYSCDGMRCGCMCVCAAVQVAPILRTPPRKPCDLSGASLTTRTRRLHAVSTWRGSHNGTSLPCAQT